MLALPRMLTTVPLNSVPLSITASGLGLRLTLRSGPVTPLTADAMQVSAPHPLLPLPALSTHLTTTSAMLARLSQMTIALR